ncbi:hypothetical protein [Microbacterium trichothecenolyticum]|uniref:hypothetical protein n=1 Tax=Microbacterium trichothecenolyticum TaxID=69370 RepID=UPI000ADCBFEE|nr:hypothetical protein [Microbacterium trichothecenolyticum]
MPDASQPRAERQRRAAHDGRSARVTDLMQSIARIVETGGYPKENPCSDPI